MSKLKILYFGKVNKKFLKNVMLQLKDAWLFDQPDLDFFRISVQDEEGAVVCIFDADANDLTQVKEKFGGLRFYMTCGTDEIFNLVGEAEELSYKTCEECGKPGEEKDTGWIRTLCDDCHENWDKIRSKRWEEE